MDRMEHAHWWKEAKIYELYVDKFAGNFKNLAGKLDYFQTLGVNTLHVLPHYPSPMVDDGYDVMDFENVRTELGTLDDFDTFIREAHARGIRVIIDLVLNHVSVAHPWFQSARTSRESPYRNYFLWHDNEDRFQEGWNAFPQIKRANWIYNDATNDYYYATFYPEQPDLNWDNPDVFHAMQRAMDFWADRGVDGFRLDAVLTLVKRDGTPSKGLPETHAIIKRIRAHLDAKYGGRIALLAESHMEVEEIAQFFGNGDECHMAYHFPMMETLYLALLFDEHTRVKDMVTKSASIPPNCTWVYFLRNHDEISLATLPLIRRTTLISLIDPHAEYLFNYGQATALRLANIFPIDQDRREALRLLYSLPGASVMYYGDEIGMRNLPRTEGALDTRVFVRGAFDWDEALRQMNDSESLFHYIAHILRS